MRNAFLLSISLGVLGLALTAPGQTRQPSGADRDSRGFAPDQYRFDRYESDSFSAFDSATARDRYRAGGNRDFFAEERRSGRDYGDWRMNDRWDIDFGRRSRFMDGFGDRYFDDRDRGAFDAFGRDRDFYDRGMYGTGREADDNRETFTRGQRGWRNLGGPVGRYSGPDSTWDNSRSLWRTLGSDRDRGMRDDPYWDAGADRARVVKDRDFGNRNRGWGRSRARFESGRDFGNRRSDQRRR